MSKPDPAYQAFKALTALQKDEHLYDPDWYEAQRAYLASDGHLPAPKSDGKLRKD